MVQLPDLRIIRSHIDYLRRTGASPVTQSYREGVLRRLSGALPVPLLAATPHHLDTWQSGLTVSLSTVAGYTSHVRRFYAWAVEASHLDVDPTTRLPRTKVPKRQPRPIPPDDLRTAIACAPEPIRTWIVLASFMGLRAAEIAGMTRDAVIELHGQRFLDGIGKGCKPFRLPVPQLVADQLRPHLIGGRGAMWRTGPGGRPARPVDVSAQAAAFFRRIGMPYTLHQCRHSFGSALYSSTKDLLLVQQAMRHESPETTRLYVATTSSATTAAMDKLATTRLAERRSRRARAGTAGADARRAA